MAILLNEKFFAKRVLEDGGDIKPLIIESAKTNGTAIFNPSIYNDDGKLLVNIRHCQYTFYHSRSFQHSDGPLVYLHPEDDRTLTTTNYLCALDDKLDIKECSKVDTSKLDVKPIWDFVGLEDGRVVRWDNKLYLTGVRRDTTTTGQGRMELSEIVDNKEVSRFRIPAIDEESYCEKNWMPIIDMPYHYVKWTNPTEVVKVDPEKGTCEVVIQQTDALPTTRDLRGGSHVIPWEHGYLCVIHEVEALSSMAGKKDGRYPHRFVSFDKEFKINMLSNEFHFMGAEVEFVTGMCEHKGNFLVSFGFSDNAAFVLSCPKKSIMDIML
jgi:predicted GH43/DUF377 family glycosyl hydrolase